MASQSGSSTRRRRPGGANPGEVSDDAGLQGRAEEGKTEKHGSLGLLACLVAFRVGNALLVRTQFDPDEFWQVLEPARALVYGQGWLTWEWQPSVALRSWLHPVVYSAPWWAAKITGLDYVIKDAVTFGLLPRILMQAPLMAFTEYSIATKLIPRLFPGDSNAAHAWLFLSLTNWFNFFCGIRTYSNSLEGCLLALALCYWPLAANELAKSKITIALVLAFLSIAVRPSSLVAWIVLGLSLVFTDIGLHNLGEAVKLIVGRVIPSFIVVFSVAIAVDSYFYGTTAFSLWTFIKLNVLHDIASLYGTHPWHWYVSQTIPAVLGIQLVPVLVGLWTFLTQDDLRVNRGSLNRLLLVIGAVTVALSAQPHKEMRFVYPLINLFLLFAVIGVKKLPSSRLVWIAILIAGLIPSLFLGLFFQRGAVDAIAHISSHGYGTVDFLLPCHATPFWAFVHPRLSKVRDMTFLDCSPRLESLRMVANLNSSFANDMGLSERKVFESNPAAFTLNRLRTRGKPDVLVTGTKFIDGVESGLRELGVSYTECGRFGWAREEDVGDEFAILCLK